MKVFPDRRFVSLVLIALMMTGCSKAVVVPRQEFAAASHATDVKHRIELNDGSHYTVRRFTVTDSTLVIVELNPSDDRYRVTRLPLAMALRDVVGISVLEVDGLRTSMLVLGVMAVAVAITLAVAAANAVGDI